VKFECNAIKLELDGEEGEVGQLNSNPSLFGAVTLAPMGMSKFFVTDALDKYALLFFLIGQRCR
jgi:hypothetical protein